MSSPYPQGTTAVATRPKLRVLSSEKAIQFADSEESRAMLNHIDSCKRTKTQEMSRLSDLSDRYDDLYYPNEITEGGADHNPSDPQRSKDGGVHLSLNTFPVYVDVPAALQAVTPIENIVPTDPEEEGSKETAAAVERVYFSWKEQVGAELKFAKAATTKHLYGRSAAKVWWDEELSAPTFSVIDQPRNLWLGWSSSEYERLDWAIYIYRLSPMQIMEEYGLDCHQQRHSDGEMYPVVLPPDNLSLTRDSHFMTTRDWLSSQDWGMVEVHDFWYRKPKGRPVKGKRTEMVTCNAILVGNVMVKNDEHEEYEGAMPYVPVFNTYIPGVPDGRPALYDVEHLLREKEERLQQGGAMVNKAVAGQMFQLTGPDAPDKVPSNAQPKPNRVVAPGAGNRIESIDPWMPEFQLDKYLDRLDRELDDVSGLNELLRGMAPSGILSSSKAINALVANYETRIAMSRDLYYVFRTSVWGLAVTIWKAKETRLKPILESASRVMLKNPSLTPRDDAELAQVAVNLLNSKVWSQRRAMDVMRVEDPESEQDDIRQERTDASMFPADVQTQAALTAQYQQIAMTQQQQAASSPAGGASGPGQPLPVGAGGGPLGARLQEGAPKGTPSMNDPALGVQMPPENMPANAQQMAMEQLLAGGGFQQNPAGSKAVSQTMIKGGEPTNRLLLQQPLGEQPEA